MSRNHKLKHKASDLDKEIGKNLKRVRQIAGFTQQYVAEAIGVSFQQIQKYEQGQNRVSASTLLTLAELFNVSPNSLLCFDEATHEDWLTSTAVEDKEIFELIRLFKSIKDKKIRKNIRIILGKVVENSHE